MKRENTTPAYIVELMADSARKKAEAKAAKAAARAAADSARQIVRDFARMRWTNRSTWERDNFLERLARDRDRS